MDIGGCGRHGVNQLRLTVHTNRRLHAEIPLVALLGLMHLRIPLLLAVLRRTGRTNDGRIHDGPLVDLHAVSRQIGTDPRKALLAQLMGFQQMPKLTARRLVGSRLTPQITPHKLPHGARVIQRFLHRRIRQVEPLLQTMEPQHALDPHRWTARPVGLGIQRLDDRHQFRPGHHAIHFVEKLLAASGLAILFKRDVGKYLLVPEVRLPFRAALPVAHYEKGISQTFLRSRFVILIL